MRRNIGEIKLLVKRPIRVHSWGGLGSQIFACVVARRLVVRFPKRKVILVFHSAGVTHRVIEVSEDLTSSFQFGFVDDFRPLSGTTEANQNRGGTLKRFLIAIFERIGFLARLNKERDFASISSRILEVRGHYTQIQLSKEEIVWVVDSLKLMERLPNTDKKLSTAIHLRLGDLLTLKSKSHIGLDRLGKAVTSAGLANKIEIYSDSKPEVVSPLIESILGNRELDIFHLETTKVIIAGIYARTFIGTNSKISLWIAIFRLALDLGEVTVLPKEIATQARHILGLINYSKALIEY